MAKKNERQASLPQTEVESNDAYGSGGGSSSVPTPPTDSAEGITPASTTLGAGGKSARKGKAVQWLDHQQAAPGPGPIFREQPPSELIDNQTAEQLKELKQQRSSEHLRLERLKAKERQLQRFLAEDQRPSPHALDEKGSDPNLFFELTTALERHQSQVQGTSFQPALPAIPPAAFAQADSPIVENQVRTAPATFPPPPLPKVHYFPPSRQSRGSVTMGNLPPIETQTSRDTSHNPVHESASTDSPRSSSRLLPPVGFASISGTQTPGASTAESSPDSAMRRAMLPIVPGEDLPPPLIGSGHGAKGLWANLRQRASMKRAHNVPDAVIYEGESAGLPSRGRPVYEDEGTKNGEVDVDPRDVEAYARSQARKLVHAHTRSTKRSHRFARRVNDTTDDDTDDGEKRKKKAVLFRPRHKRTKSKDYGNAEIDKMSGGYAITESDIERDADSLSLHSSILPRHSGGVLGALLALYNTQNGLDSITPSGASTPTLLDEPISRSRTRTERELQVERANRVDSSDATKVELVHSKSLPAHFDADREQGNSNERVTSSPTSPRFAGSTNFHANAMSKSGVKSTARKLLRLGTYRPVQSRNAGGVFGSLIASTGNITGAAAPTASTVAPNVDRPGFTLTRYGYDEEKSDLENQEPFQRGHHSGAKSLGQLELESARTGGTNKDDAPLGRVSTAPAEVGLGALDGLPFISETASPSDDPGDYFGSHHSSTRIAAGTTPRFKAKNGKVHSRLPPFPEATTPGGTPLSLSKRANWTGVLKDLPTGFHFPYAKSGKSTPATTPGSTTTASDRGEWLDGWAEKEGREEREKREKRERDKKERKKRKKAELFITRHVAQIIQRQEFICKLARSMMMYGSPTHRLTAQIQATGRVLDIELSCMYLPDVMLISFEDSSTGTSLIKFIKQGSVLNLGKLSEGYMIYWKVIHDEVSVSDASAALDKLMRQPPRYNWWQLMLIGGLCPSAICTVSFAGSFIDSIAVFPLGAILVGIQQLSIRNELYSNVFEITIATLFSFICGCLATSKRICFSAAASSSIVLILPGFIVLSGGLEILSRNIVAGSVRLCYAVVYCLFLGFGLAMGAEAFEKIVGTPIFHLTDTSCSVSHDANGPWWQRTPSKFWAFLTVPLYSLVLSMRNHQPLFCREMLICVAISCVGWVVTYFVNLKFQSQTDFASAVGAFVIGMISNLGGRFLDGNAFTIMITGILFQVPSGLGNGGLLEFVEQQTDNTGSSKDAYLSGFQTALSLISVAIGLTIGLGIALFMSHPIPSRRRAGGVFSL